MSRNCAPATSFSFQSMGTSRMSGCTSGRAASCTHLQLGETSAWSRSGQGITKTLSSGADVPQPVRTRSDRLFVDDEELELVCETLAGFGLSACDQRDRDDHCRHE